MKVELELGGESLNVTVTDGRRVRVKPYGAPDEHGTWQVADADVPMPVGIILVYLLQELVQLLELSADPQGKVGL